MAAGLSTLPGVVGCPVQPVQPVVGLFGCFNVVEKLEFSAMPCKRWQRTALQRVKEEQPEDGDRRGELRTPD